LGLTQAGVQDLRLSQWCCWEFKFSGMLCVFGRVVRDVFKALWSF